MVGTSNSSNITLKQLTGSSIKLHTNSDGSVYAYGDTAIDDDVVHDDGSVTQATNQGGGNWDGPLNYKYAYHGAVVGLITPGSNEINVTYKANYHNWSAGEWQGIWVTMQTIIPQTPTVNYQTYVAKDSSVSYHYNVTLLMALNQLSLKGRETIANHKKGLIHYCIKSFLQFFYETIEKEGATMDFLDSPEALQAKAEVENGEVGVIGTVDDLDEWIENL